MLLKVIYVERQRSCKINVRLGFCQNSVPSKNLSTPAFEQQIEYSYTSNVKTCNIKLSRFFVKNPYDSYTHTDVVPKSRSNCKKIAFISKIKITGYHINNSSLQVISCFRIDFIRSYGSECNLQMYNHIITNQSNIIIINVT